MLIPLDGRQAAAFLTLPVRTVEGGTTSLEQAADAAPRRPATGAIRTGLTLAAIDRPSVLKVAQFPGGLHVIPQAAAAGRDRFLKNVADRPGQSLGALTPNAVRDASGGKACAIKSFAGIDVTEAGDHSLIQQRSLDRALATLQRRRQSGTIEGIAERLRAQPLQILAGLQFAGRKDIHVAETASVIEAHLSSLLGAQHDMVMRQEGRRVRRIDKQHPAGHAEVHQQDITAVQEHQEILCPAVDALDSPPLQPKNEIERQGKAQVRPKLPDLKQAPAFQYRLQPPANGLYFRQLRHGTKAQSDFCDTVAEAPS